MLGTVDVNQYPSSSKTPAHNQQQQQQSQQPQSPPTSDLKMDLFEEKLPAAGHSLMVYGSMEISEPTLGIFQQMKSTVTCESIRSHDIEKSYPEVSRFSARRKTRFATFWCRTSSTSMMSMPRSSRCVPWQL